MEYPEHLLQQLQAHPPSTADGLMAQLLLHPWPLYWYEQVRASDLQHLRRSGMQGSDEENERVAHQP